MYFINSVASFVKCMFLHKVVIYLRLKRLNRLKHVKKGNLKETVVEIKFQTLKQLYLTILL